MIGEHSDMLDAFKKEHFDGVCFEQTVLQNEKPICLGDAYDNGIVAAPFLAAALATSVISGTISNLMGSRNVVIYKEQGKIETADKHIPDNKLRDYIL